MSAAACASPSRSSRAARPLPAGALLLGWLLAVPVAGQEAAAPGAAPGGWRSQCVSAARAGPADCVVERRVGIDGAGQAVVTVSLRMPAEPRSPALMIATPLGLYLPAGLRLQVDDGEAQRLEVQGCDSNGCYVGAPVSPALLAALRTGRTLRLTLESLARQAFGVEVPLAGLDEGLARIE